MDNNEKQSEADARTGAKLDFQEALSALRVWSRYLDVDAMLTEPNFAAEQINLVRNWLQVMLTNAEFLCTPKDSRTAMDQLIEYTDQTSSCLARRELMAPPSIALWDALKKRGWFERICARCSTHLLTKADVEICPMCEAKLREIARA